MSCSVHQEAIRWYEEQKAKRANFENWATKIEKLTVYGLVGPALTELRHWLRDQRVMKVGDLMAACIRAEDPDVARRLWDLAKEAEGPF